MLAFAFFTLIFSSLLWLIYAIRFINDSLAGISFFDAGIANIMLYTLLVCLPIFLMWAVFGFVNQYLNNKNVNLQLRKLLSQMKKNQDYSDLLARVLIETEQHINDGFVLTKFDLLIADMNELLSEIIRGCKLASAEQIENLWNKVQNGGKWSFGKVIIEVHNSQPNFQKRIFEHAVYDPLLGGTIMEFCARYQAVVEMLDKHDQDKVFFNMIETGVMGKVFSILSPIAAELRRGREAASNFTPKKEKATPMFKPEPRVQPARLEVGQEETDVPKESFLKKLNIFKKKEDEEPLFRQEPERDPFSIALERSFADEPQEPTISMADEEPVEEPAAPSIQIDEPQQTAPEIVLPKTEPTDTQKALDSLKKEWAEVKMPAKEEAPLSKEEPSEEPNLAYPFGNWTDEQNYQK